MLENSAALQFRQPSLPTLCPVTAAVDGLSKAGVEARGAVFTRREVVDFILDLTGYTADRPLHRLRHLEPSFGRGDFLFPALERLLNAWKADARRSDAGSLASCVKAVELHGDTFEKTRTDVVAFLIENGVSSKTAVTLADNWLVLGDFLLVPLSGDFDVVVGNPPYVRQELIPDALISEYRSRYKTVYDRADLYIPFIERSLSLLSEGGALGFICADRWMKNRYGGPLRQFVSAKYNLRIYVDMVNTPAFHSDVIAYPAITVIGREKAGPTRVARRPEISHNALAKLSRELMAESPSDNCGIQNLNAVTSGAEPWILDASHAAALLRRLENDFPKIEDAGCKVGIGVATGADKAFIGPFDQLNVEPDRKLPLAMTRDILDGTVKWRGLGVINPFDASGQLVDLDRYPRLSKYLDARKNEIAGRHCAQKTPRNWYRTIDRIYPSLAGQPKLLIPDIKGQAHVVFEEGKLYPHHNLYFVTSTEWDLRALQAVLMSGVARLFVAAYSTRMRGGYLRFQAQYLRRIRIPRWADIPPDLKTALVSAAKRGDLSACNRATYAVYRMTEDEVIAMGANGDEHGD